MEEEASNAPRLVDPVLRLACDILEGYIRKNTLPASDVPAALRSIYRALSMLQGAPTTTSPSAKPAVPVKKSVAEDYLVCLEDGREVAMLKRHLRARHGLSPEDYRAKWGLPADYPMTAPRYAKVRSALAKAVGLGQYPAPGTERGTRKDARSRPKS